MNNLTSCKIDLVDLASLIHGLLVANFLQSGFLGGEKKKLPHPQISTQRCSLYNLPLIERLLMAPVDIPAVIIVFKSTQKHGGGSSQPSCKQPSQA